MEKFRVVFAKNVYLKNNFRICEVLNCIKHLFNFLTTIRSENAHKVPFEM